MLEDGGGDELRGEKTKKQTEKTKQKNAITSNCPLKNFRFCTVAIPHSTIKSKKMMRDVHKNMAQRCL